MMLGLLLARAGVETLVLEKHADFLRDFRGDTMHPSTLEVIAELGLLDELLALPHDRVAEIAAQFGDTTLMIADFRHLPVRCGFIAMMPQWDFLNFLAKQGGAPSAFPAAYGGRSDGPDRGGVSVVGLKLGDEEIRPIWWSAPTAAIRPCGGRPGSRSKPAGRRSTCCGSACAQARPADSLGRFDTGAIFVLINRRDYWQCGYVIPQRRRATKSARAGLPAFRDRLAQLLPLPADRVASSRDWDHVKLLTVQIDRLQRWCRPGLLCIGDAAHAMSPVGGVGINLAIQDAVAAGNMLGGGDFSTAICAASSAVASFPRASPSASKSWCRTASFPASCKAARRSRCRSAFASSGATPGSGACRGG